MVALFNLEGMTRKIGNRVIFKTGNGESENENKNERTGNGESLKWGIFKSGNL